MLEKPDVRDASITACLRDEYGLHAAELVFLPLGADRDSAVYRLIGEDGAPYFVKLRRGPFDDIVVTLPKFLHDRGIAQVIPPLVTRRGLLWASVGAFRVILYPFVEGRDGYEVALSDRQWSELGSTLKRIHSVELPPSLKRGIARETYAPYWRNRVRTFLQDVETPVLDDPMAAELASFLQARRALVRDLVDRAGQHARTLLARSGEPVLCHSDIHAGNILVDAGGALYIVDWDSPILAPKERDLMFAGGAQGFIGRTPQEEEAQFYRGYGQTAIDPVALAYYRYERIVEDIAVFCEQILLYTGDGPDREQSLRYLRSNFLPDGTIEVAYRSDRTAG